MLILGGLRSVTGAVLGTLLITMGLELVRWLETGPVLIGVKLPQNAGFIGLAAGGGHRCSDGLFTKWHHGAS